MKTYKIVWNDNGISEGDRVIDRIDSKSAKDALIIFINKNFNNVPKSRIKIFYTKPPSRKTIAFSSCVDYFYKTKRHNIPMLQAQL